ncbi:TPA: hypothetical protein ACNEKJ_005167, partial [Escherichia coli]
RLMATYGGQFTLTTGCCCCQDLIAHKPRLSYWYKSIFKSTLKSTRVEKTARTNEVWLFPTTL